MKQEQSRARDRRIYQDYQQWKQDKGTSVGFRAYAAEKYSVGTRVIERIVKTRGNPRYSGPRKKPVIPWTSKYNLYLDPEDGKPYYADKARSTDHKLIVEAIDIDGDVWCCIGDNGQIDPKKLAELTRQRKQNPGHC